MMEDQASQGASSSSISQNIERVAECRPANQRKRYASDEPEAQKIRNYRKKARRICRDAKLEAKLKFYVTTADEKVELWNKMDKIKSILGKGTCSSANVNNYQTLQTIMDFYLSHNGEKTRDNTNAETVGHAAVNSYQHCGIPESKEEMYLTTRSSLDHLIKQVQGHDQSCTAPVKVVKENRLHHAIHLTMKCTNDCGHFTWTSSPHVTGGKLLVNVRMLHAYL